MERFIDSVAVVNGCNKGIGTAIARELLSRNIIVCGLSSEEQKLRDFERQLQEEGIANFYAFQCNPCRENDLAVVFTEIIKKIGVITIFINNSGICPRSSITDITQEHIDATLSTNIKAMIIGSRQAISSMKINSVAGHIINICSIAGHPGWAVKKDLVVFSATKQALRTISDGLRRELISDVNDIKITNLSPGIIETQAVEHPETIDRYKLMVPDDVAGAVVHILNTPPHILIREMVVTPLNEAL